MLTTYVDPALVRLEDWVARLTDLLPPPIREPLLDGDFRWRFPEDSLEVLLLCKTVRLSTALAGAWELAQRGLTTESGTLLRAVGDFASEINFMSEAAVEGRFTRAQKDFLEHFFRPLPRSMEEFLLRDKEYYVARKEISKVERAMAEKAGQDSLLFDNLSSFLSYGLNKYVHGAYETAMEIYHGGLGRFSIGGASGRPREAAMKMVAAKATEALHAVLLVALVLGAGSVVDEIKVFLNHADPTLGSPARPT